MLPLVSLSADSSDGYLANGITEEITKRIVARPGLSRGVADRVEGVAGTWRIAGGDRRGT